MTTTTSGHDRAGDRRADDDRIYPCRRCGTLRSKNEGGTVFTVCDACWDATAPTPDTAGRPDSQEG